MAFSAELARRLDHLGVTSNAADPGFVRSGLGRDAPGTFGLFLKASRPLQASPDKGAATPAYLALSPEVAEVTGKYFAKCRATEPSALTQDRDLARRLWDLSAKLTTGKEDRDDRHQRATGVA